VVPQRHGVHAEKTEETEIRFPPVGIEIQGPLHGVSGVQEQAVSGFRPQFRQCGGELWESSQKDPRPVPFDPERPHRRFQVRMGIVDVKNGEAQRLPCQDEVRRAEESGEEDPEKEAAENREGRYAFLHDRWASRDGNVSCRASITCPKCS